MKIIVLYGTGEVSKRSEILKIKKEFLKESITQIDFKTAGLKELKILSSSPGLFTTGSRLVVVENVSDKLNLQDIQIDNPEVTILIVAGDLTETAVLLKSAKTMKVKVVKFDGDKEITAFAFLDLLIDQKKEALLELEKLFLGYGGMYILTMIYYLLRRNLLPLPTSSFMQKKIKQQKQNYNLDDWQRFYYFTLKTEFDIKNGLISEKLGVNFLVMSTFLKNSLK